MNLAGKVSKVSWPLRLSALLLAAGSYGMVSMALTFCDLLAQHHLQAWLSVFVPLLFLVACACLLFSVVSSIICLFRRDWFGLIGLLAAALAVAGVILAIRDLSSGEI